MSLPRAYEDQLVERAKEDPQAFAELYDHYVGQIYRFVYSRLRDQDAAEDVTAEVFFKALRGIRRYRPSGHPFSAWLYQISVNAITDYYRGRRPEADLDVAVGIPAKDPPVDEQVTQREEAARVWAAIDSLPPQQRIALTLKLGEDLKLAQIGQIMGKSEGAVKLLVHRGMLGVRQRLGLVPARQASCVTVAGGVGEAPGDELPEDPGARRPTEEHAETTVDAEAGAET